MSQWHPPVENAAHWHVHQERWRDIRETNPLRARRVRPPISAADQSDPLDDPLNDEQCNELLSVLTLTVDATRRP
jgi:hypothetical protein